MIADPFYLRLIVGANADIESAIENLSSDDPNYDKKHTALVVVSRHIEALIIDEVLPRGNPVTF